MPPRIRLSPVPIAPERIAPVFAPAVALPTVPVVVVTPAVAAVAVVPPPSDISAQRVMSSPVAGLTSTAAVPLGVGPAVSVAPVVVVAQQGARSGVSGAADFQLPVAPPKPTGEGAIDEPVSTALMNQSIAPALIRSSGLLIKWGAILTALLGAGYLAMKTLVPLMKEISNPKPPPAVIEKNAPSLVKVLQQTRQVTSKSDANVAYLNEVIGEPGAKVPVVKAPVVVAPAPPPPAVEVPLAKGDLTPFQSAIAQLKIDGAVGGAAPRAFIDGRLVKYGEIVDRSLGLRFVGVDMEEHVVLFTNADNVMFKKHF